MTASTRPESYYVYTGGHDGKWTLRGNVTSLAKLSDVVGRTIGDFLQQDGRPIIRVCRGTSSHPNEVVFESNTYWVTAAVKGSNDWAHVTIPTRVLTKALDDARSYVEKNPGTRARISLGSIDGRVVSTYPLPE